MSSRRSSPARRSVRGKKNQSKEEMERLAREEKEKHEREDTLRREKEAEDKQKLENDLRDKTEDRDRKRMKKEAQAAALTEKDFIISQLTKQCSDINKNHTSMKAEVDEEIQRLLHLKEALENELSNTFTDLQFTQQELMTTRQSHNAECQNYREKIAQLTNEHAEYQQKTEKQIASLSTQVTKLSAECQLLRSSKEDKEKESTDRIRNLEREVEKMTSLSETMQEVIESKELEDKKNLAMMTLLSAQLDDQKLVSSKTNESERAKNQQLLKELSETKERLLTTLVEHQTLMKNMEDLEASTTATILDYKGQLDRMKFDTKFLHAELCLSRNKLQHTAEETNQKMSKSTATRESLIQQLEQANQKIESLEQQIRKKEREFFDKSTFFNAQIANNRTIIQQMQTKQQLEKDQKQKEINAITEELQRRTSRIADLESDHDKSKLQQSEAEIKLHSDLNLMKTTTFQLQTQLFDKERTMERLLSEKEQEVQRLRRKLDEAFIPYRSGG